MSKHQAWESLQGEEWRDVVGFEGHYKVSSYGRVLSVARVCNVGLPCGQREVPERLLLGTVQKKRGRPYALTVSLRDGVKPNPRSYTISRLVAEAFIGPRPSSDHVATHQNREPLDCRSVNVAWDTFSAINLRRGIKPRIRTGTGMRRAQDAADSQT